MPACLCAKRRYAPCHGDNARHVLFRSCKMSACAACGGMPALAGMCSGAQACGAVFEGRRAKSCRRQKWRGWEWRVQRPEPRVEGGSIRIVPVPAKYEGVIAVQVAACRPPERRARETKVPLRSARMLVVPTRARVSCFVRCPVAGMLGAVAVRKRRERCPSHDKQRYRSSTPAWNSREARQATRFCVTTHEVLYVAAILKAGRVGDAHRWRRCVMNKGGGAINTA